MNSLVSSMKHSRPDSTTKPAKTVSSPLRATAVPEKKIFHATRIPMRRNKVPKYYCWDVHIISGGMGARSGLDRSVHAIA